MAGTFSNLVSSAGRGVGSALRAVPGALANAGNSFASGLLGIGSSEGPVTRSNPSSGNYTGNPALRPSYVAGGYSNPIYKGGSYYNEQATGPGNLNYSQSKTVLGYDPNTPQSKIAPVKSTSSSKIDEKPVNSAPVKNSYGQTTLASDLYGTGSANMNDAYSRVKQAEVGATPSSTSGSPFINSVNTQQNYASGAGNSEVNKSVSGLQNIAQGQTPEVRDAYNNIKNFNQQTPLLESTQANIPMAAVISTGRGQILGNQLSGISQGLSNTYGAAVQGEGQQISAGTNAASAAQNQIAQQQSSAANVGSLTQPQSGAAFFGSPVTGETVGNGGIGGSNLVNTGVGQAIQQARNGADPVALRNQLVSQFGAPAGVAFDQAMGGGYNPTASSASAQQTASQGAMTGGQAYALETASKQIETLKPLMINVLQKSGINPRDEALMNGPINDYIAQLHNPEASAAYNAMVNELSNFSSQILNAGTALTPTGVTAATELQDPSRLSLNQIGDYLGTLGDIATNKLSVLQGQAQASGYTGYAGNPVNPVTSTNVSNPSTAPGANISSSGGQFRGGIGIDVGRWAMDVSKNGLAAGLMGFIAGHK